MWRWCSPRPPPIPGLRDGGRCVPPWPSQYRRPEIPWRHAGAGKRQTPVSVGPRPVSPKSRTDEGRAPSGKTEPAPALDAVARAREQYRLFLLDTAVVVIDGMTTSTSRD